ncbi:MAG TPA: FAD:protein FMN transferase [Gemmatimonadales bacterium]|nr:FAD:protein FMN transferase [Gemmatimonadales bacterium]
MRRRRFLGALGAGLAAAAAPRWLSGSAVSSADAGSLVERWSWAMGQPVRLQLYAASESAGYAAAQAALAELRRVESILSRFDEASDLSELNRRAGRGPVAVAPDLLAVLTAAVEFRRSTGGAFDVAIEPLMRAWGFHAPRSAEPTVAELAGARAAVRAATLAVDGGRVALGGATAGLDLGGIGVGYGLDRAVEVLRRSGIRRALLDVSGDCVALGAPPDESGWLVEMADPERPGEVIGSTRLRDAALATSSNLTSVIRYGRAVRGQVIDPASGYPAARCRQVTVVALTGVQADALSTAMLISPARPRGVLRSWVV